MHLTTWSGGKYGPKTMKLLTTVPIDK
jgi:hypothetical protein